MTYQDIVNWSEQNVPMGLAKGSFSKWLSLIDAEFLNSGHFLPKEVEPMLEKRWLKFHDTKEVAEKGEEEPIKEPEPPRGTIGKQLDARFERLPSGIEFTPKQVASWTGFNKNTVRRELQEFTEQGRLQRTAKGRYRVV